MAVGEVAISHPLLQLQRPDAKIRDSTGRIIETIVSDVPDLVIAAGTLKSMDTVVDHASFLIRYRRGQTPHGELPLSWTVTGETGEIRISGDSPSINSHFFTEPPVIEVHDFASNSVNARPWSWTPWQEKLPASARNIGMLYELFAAREEGKYADFAAGLARYRQIDGILSSWQQ
jgi:hypothetical protein